MKEFLQDHWKPLGACVGMMLSAWFLLDPGPYPMALFAFVAQPIFFAVFIGYLVSIRRDLRRRKVL